MSVASNEEHQVQDLEQLVEAGNWEALVAAGNTQTDVDDEGSQQTLSDESTMSADFAQQHWSVCSHGSSSRGTCVSSTATEIADLVKTVVPDELGT
jgi:hypothetical protein